MVFIEKSQPAPPCLEIEKGKANGNYRCEDVIERIFTDFHNKCYLCEQKGITTSNVEHFAPHKGDIHLKFDWNNLYLSCGHCNNTKLAQYDNILNCCRIEDQVDTQLQYELKPFPFEQVRITALNSDERTTTTAALLLSIYNGTTAQKRLESANLRTAILKEIRDFQDALDKYYFESISEDDRDLYARRIKKHLHKTSAFTAFKRWIIRDNPEMMKTFGQYLND